jgi:hypothetical protein
MESGGVPADRLDDQFRGLLGELELADLEQERWPAYGMWLDSSLAYLNPAYARQMPPSWGLGAKVLDATGVLRASVERVHASVCATREPAVLRYACPTASREREFELRVFPVGLTTGEVRGLLAIHSLVVDRPRTPTITPLTTRPTATARASSTSARTAAAHAETASRRSGTSCRPTSTARPSTRRTGSARAVPRTTTATSPWSDDDEGRSRRGALPRRSPRRATPA